MDVENVGAVDDARSLKAICLDAGRIRWLIVAIGYPGTQCDISAAVSRSTTVRVLSTLLTVAISGRVGHEHL